MEEGEREKKNSPKRELLLLLLTRNYSTEKKINLDRVDWKIIIEKENQKNNKLKKFISNRSRGINFMKNKNNF